MTGGLTRPVTGRVGPVPLVWLVATAATGAGLLEVWLAHRSSGPGGIIERRYGLLAVLSAWSLAYLAAVLCVLRLPRRTAVVLVLLLAVALRLVALSPKAPLSDDLYRYAWDGRVQVSGTDPYRYPPLAPELADLRTEWLFPSDNPRNSGTQINRPSVRTIYPPVAEAWFALEHLVLPDDTQDRGYEGIGLLLDLAVVAVLLALLRDRRWVALYALAPLPALEAVQNAHVDVLAVLLTLGALHLAERRKPVGAAAALAMAALVKLYPVVLLPVLLRGRSAVLRGSATFVAVCLAAYLPHVLAVGTRIFGYLPGYLAEEKYDEGGRFLLLGIVGLAGAAAKVVAALLLVGLGVWALRTTLPVREAAVRMFAGVLLIVTPVQPWYALTLLALATLARAWWAVPLSLAAYPVFFATVLAGPGPVVGRISYGVAAAVVAGGLLSSGSTQRARRSDDAPPRPASDSLAPA
ncbi:MAG: glycosyltransferase 87 family protein [Mycobacteriales bacterium]